jgi:hypothetical protein
LLKITTVAALLSIGGTSHAGNELEVGAMAGLHVFSDDSGLGASRMPGPPSEQDAPLAGIRVGWFYRHVRHARWYGSLLGAEAEVGIGSGDARGAGTGVVNLTYRAHAVVQLRTADPDVRIVPFVVLGAGAFEISRTDDARALHTDRDGMGYAGGGAKFRFAGGWEARVDGRVLLGPSRAGGVTEDFEALVSFGRRFGQLAAEPAAAR